MFHRWSELVGQRNQQLGRSVGWLVGVAVRGKMGVKKKKKKICPQRIMVFVRLVVGNLNLLKPDFILT